MFVGPIHHVSIITRDTERALAFWREATGWKVLADGVSGGSELDRALGMSGVKKRAVALCPPEDIHTGMLELVEFYTPKGTPLKGDAGLNDPGGCVLSFRVKDCDKAYAELKNKGARFLGPPTRDEVGGWAFKAAIFRDPVDNCMAEIIEFLPRAK